MGFAKSGDAIREHGDHRLGGLHIYLNHNESTKFSDRHHGPAHIRQNEQDKVFVAQLQKIRGLQVSCQKNTTIYEQGKPVQTDAYHIVLLANNLQSIQRTLKSIQQNVTDGYNKLELISVVNAVIAERTPKPLKSASASKKPRPPEHSLQKKAASTPKAATLPPTKPNSAPLQEDDTIVARRDDRLASRDADASILLEPCGSTQTTSILPLVQPASHVEEDDLAASARPSRKGAAPDPSSNDEQDLPTEFILDSIASRNGNDMVAPRGHEDERLEQSVATKTSEKPSWFRQAIQWISAKIQSLFPGIFGSKSKQAPADTHMRVQAGTHLDRAPGVFTKFGNAINPDGQVVGKQPAEKQTVDTSLRAKFD